MKIIDFEISDFKNGAYMPSTVRNMTLLSDFNKELEKTRYIADKRQRLIRVRELLKDKSAKTGVHIERGNIVDYKKLGFETIEDYYKEKENGMFFNIWVEISIKRVLEVECYLLDIFDKADELAKTNDFEAITYLIDQKYKIHTGIFDEPKSDELYNDEYNALIFDLIQNKINSISKMEITPIGDTIKTVTKKPLTWNANKNTIGTLFGMLLQNKIITGTQADICKGLSALFSNLSESTLKDNLNLKINTNDDKKLYDIETENLLKEWIEHLKKQKTKKTTHKVP